MQLSQTIGSNSINATIDVDNFDAIGKNVYVIKYFNDDDPINMFLSLQELLIGIEEVFDVQKLTLDTVATVQKNLKTNETFLIASDMIISKEVMEVTLPAFFLGGYYIGAHTIVNSVGDFADVKFRWTNDDGSCEYSSAFLMHHLYDQSSDDLKVTPSIADKVLSFAVSAREGELGLRSSSYVYADNAKTYQVNATDGRIVKSFPADQDLSAVTETQDISAQLTYETGDAAQFSGKLTIPRIEAGQVSIDATEVFSADGGKVVFNFEDSSSYIDGASKNFRYY